MGDLLARLQAAFGDRYTIERELGHGGMAHVFLAEDRKHRRHVAVKVLRPELAAVIGPDRFLREIEIAAKLTHPHILALYDSGEADGLLYYVMPYVEGESLRERLTREQQLPLDDAVLIVSEVADALSYAHAHDVVHRDIKPENVLLEAGHAVVSDFGIARAITAAGGEQLTETGIALGTPAYMSPEQAAAQRKVDARSDLYSLGCVYYEMLAGHPPFLGRTPQEVLARHILDPVPPLRTVRPELPEAIERTIYRALAKSPADRFATVDQFVQELSIRRAGRAAQPLRIAIRRHPVLAIGGGAVLLVALSSAALFFRTRPRVALDPNVVAIAPFDVLNPQLSLWREGLVDVVSRGLDGAGPIRTVSPMVALRGWRGQADAASAEALGRRTHAGIVVFGNLMDAGADSVRLTAGLLDVAAARLIGDIEVRGVTSRMDRLTDSLTVALVRELGRIRPVAAVRSAWLGSHPLPVLKAFLHGEQFYRGAVWDSAMTQYQRAVALDSAFPLAWHRMSDVLGCFRRGVLGHPQAVLYSLRAGALNRGLPTRDSLLIVADSVFDALNDGPADPLWREHRGRLWAILEDATRRYPTDPEVWFKLGDALVHLPPAGKPTLQPALDAFDRAIAVDSGFGPAYLHPVELSLALGHTAAARRYLAGYLALKQADSTSEGMGLLQAVLDHPAPWPPEVERQMRDAPAYALAAATWAIRDLPDSGETAIALARAFLNARKTGDAFADDSSARIWFVAMALANRGHVREAYRVAGEEFPYEYAEFATLGVVRPGTARASFTRWLHEPLARVKSFDDLAAHLATLSWWAAQRDTGALRAASRQWASLSGAAQHSVELGLWAGYGRDAARAYESLADGDTARALRRFEALPDSVCPCLLDRIVTAELLATRGRLEDAKAVLERSRPIEWDPAEGLWWVARAGVAERAGDRPAAIHHYRFLTELWRKGDPEVAGYVEEARTALKRLAGESDR
jgi:eukaryotic-like serine/threonine-protein kinase